jgi:hypothetical protein
MITEEIFLTRQCAGLVVRLDDREGALPPDALTDLG